MATEQAWQDFKRLVEEWQGSLTQIDVLKAACDRLASLKVEILDDKQRRAAIAPIGNQYPDLNMDGIEKDVIRVMGARAILIAAGF